MPRRNRHHRRVYVQACNFDRPGMPPDKNSCRSRCLHYRYNPSFQPARIQHYIAKKRTKSRHYRSHNRDSESYIVTPRHSRLAVYTIDRLHKERYTYHHRKSRHHHMKSVRYMTHDSPFHQDIELDANPNHLYSRLHLDSHYYMIQGMEEIQHHHLKYLESVQLNRPLYLRHAYLHAD